MYGGRGITVCKEWRDSFLNFKDWALRSGYNDTLSINRIDNDSNYEPKNCEWITLEANKAEANARHMREGSGRFSKKSIAKSLETRRNQGRYLSISRGSLVYEGLNYQCVEFICENSKLTKDTVKGCIKKVLDGKHKTVGGFKVEEIKNDL